MCRRTATKTSSSTVEIRLYSSGAPPTPTTLVTRNGILRLGEIAHNAVHLDTKVTLPEASIVAVSVATSILLRCDECRMVALAILFDSFLEFDEISGHLIHQLLQSTNDLAALRCVTPQIAELPRSEPQDGSVGACLNFHHLDNSRHCGRSWLS